MEDEGDFCQRVKSLGIMNKFMMNKVVMNKFWGSNAHNGIYN
jgi:hypothetical protein